MSSRKIINNPQQRSVYLENCLKRMIKQYVKNSSPIDCSETRFVKNMWNDDTEYISSEYISSDKPIHMIVLSRGQYTHIFPHPHIFLKCSICEKNCPSEMPKEQMMILFNSPSSLFPLCENCSMSFGKKEVINTK